MVSRKIRVYVFLLIAVFAFTALFTGCVVEKKGDSGAGTTGTASATQAPKDKISIFYGTAGIQVPEGVSLEDNPFLNEIAEMANVEFTEITVPAYTDFATKFNLMVSSGNIPDFIHCWQPTEVQQHGDAGAFLELTDIIKNSPVISKKYTDEMLELMKDEKGKIYALRTLGTQNPKSIVLRKDLLDELNNGVEPTTPEGWYELFKKQKEKYPDSVPYSSGGGLMALEIFFYAYGVTIDGSGAKWQVYNDKYIHSFEAPLCKDAILFHKKLYEDGLLDQTFVTNTIQDFIDKKYNKGVIIAPNPLNSVISYIGHYVKNGPPETVIVPGRQPKVNDTRVKDENVYSAISPIGGHCVAIGAKTKNKDAVIRLIEVLMSDEVLELSSWGRKGIEYNIVSGKKKLNYDAASETAYRYIYGFMFTYGFEDHLNVILEQQLAMVEESKRDAYLRAFKDGMKIAYEQAAKVPSVTAASFVKLSTDTISRETEARELSKSIVLKAIVGEISMEEYDAQVANFLKTYQFITDEYNTKLQEAKKRLSK